MENKDSNYKKVLGVFTFQRIKISSTNKLENLSKINIGKHQTSSIRRWRFPPDRDNLLEPKCALAIPEKEVAINLQQHRAASFRVDLSSSSK